MSADAELVVEGEIVDEPSRELVHVPAVSPATLFGTDEPGEIIEKARKHADALMSVVREKNLVVTIKQKEHPLVECWTLLGSMVGVYPVVEWTRPIKDFEGKAIVGWEARVTAQTQTGAIVGGAEAECLRSESKWRSADDYAIRSMAQTRAVSKALRLPLGFIVQLAGLSATPAEEMDGVERTPSHEREADDPEQHKKALVETRKLLKKLVGQDGWTEEEVCGQAARIWGEPVSALEDLSVAQLREIAKAAKAASG